MNQAYRNLLDLYPWKFSSSSMKQALDSGLLDVSGFHQYADYANKDEEMRELLVYDPFIAVNYFRRKNFSAYVVASIKSHKLLMVSVKTKDIWTPLPLSNITTQVVDLSDGGERWEGDTLGTLPCGWGSYYSANNTAVYTGFRFWSWNVCYGTYYFEDLPSQQIRYQGTLCFSKQFGEGTTYSRMGEAINTIETISDRNIQSNDVIVPPDTNDLFYYNNLMQSFTVQKNCYIHTNSFMIVNFPYLKTIVVMSNSYSATDSGYFRIENCPELQSIRVEQDSFCHYSVFKVQNCPKLETLEFGENCFHHCLDFTLESTIASLALFCLDLASLTTMDFQSDAFCCLHELKWSSRDAFTSNHVDLPKLRLVKMDSNSIMGDKSNTTWLGYYKNTFKMSEMPSLTRILGYFNFQYFGIVRLEGRINSQEIIDRITPLR